MLFNNASSSICYNFEHLSFVLFEFAKNMLFFDDILMLSLTVIIST